MIGLVEPGQALSRESCRTLGLVECFTKPIDVDAVLSVLERTGVRFDDASHVQDGRERTGGIDALEHGLQCSAVGHVAGHEGDALCTELAELREKSGAMKAQWQNEKNALGNVGKLKQQNNAPIYAPDREMMQSNPALGPQTTDGWEAGLGTHLDDPRARLDHIQASMHESKTRLEGLTPGQIMALSAANVAPAGLTSLNPAGNPSSSYDHFWGAATDPVKPLRLVEVPMNLP